MKNNKVKKAVKIQKDLSRKPARKHHQPVANKKVARRAKATTARAKSRKPTQQSAARQAELAVLPQHGNEKVPPAAAAKPLSPQLQELERARRWKQLHDQGSSLAELAVKFRCSKSLVRDLVRLASLPDDLKQAYLEGKAGRKKVLGMDRARKKKVESKEAAVTEDLKEAQQQKPLPEAKAIVATNPQKNPPPKAQTVVAPGDFQHLLIRIAAPEMTEEERQKKVAEHAKLIIDWFRSLNLAFSFWPGYWSQVNAAMYGPFPWLFADEAPQPHEIRPGVNPLEVIKECKVERKNPQFVTDIINDLVAWLARWVQRVIPDRVMTEDAIDKARGQLLREARKARWY